jgi:tetratricopeptide (TPR) repeat protein
VEKLAAEFPTMPDYAAGVQATLSTLGLALTRQGKHAEAEKATARALQVAMKLTTDYPAVATYRHSLASGHNLMGIALYGMGRAAEAREHYRRALTVREKLAADFPAVREYRSDLGGGYCNLGLLLSDDGQPAESLSWFGKAVDTLRAAYRADPQDTTARNYLQNSYAGRAMAYSRLHKHAEAAADWDRVIDLSPGDRRLPFFRAVRATSKLPAGQVAEAVAEVVELQKLSNWNAGQLYDFACVYAVASGKMADKQREYADAAVETLVKAVAAGYKDAAHMKKDSDLDPLRGRDDFRKLLADLEAKFPPKREVQPPPRRE